MTTRLIAGLCSVGAGRACCPSNLQNDRLNRGARSLTSNPAHTVIDVTVPEPIGFRAICLGPTNFSPAARYRIRAFTSAAMTATSYDNGWVQGQARAAFGSLPFGSSALYDGFAPIDDPERGVSIIHVLPTAQFRQVWRIEIDHAGNPAGFVQIGRLYMCRSFEPSINYA